MDDIGVNRVSVILIVDDDEQTRRVLSRLLRRAGFETVFAPDGESALAYLEQAHPDLILLDVAMPRMDGLTVLERLRRTQDHRDTAVIMMSAMDDARTRSRASLLGASNYLVKAHCTWEDVHHKVLSSLPV